MNNRKHIKYNEVAHAYKSKKSIQKPIISISTSYPYKLEYLFLNEAIGSEFWNKFEFEMT